MSQHQFNLVANGDTGLTLLFTEPSSELLTRYIIALAQRCKVQFSSCLVDIIPAYQSLTLTYRPQQICYAELSQTVSKLGQSDILASQYQGQTITIPVCYGFEYGPDLAHVAKYCNMSIEELIQQHSRGEYLVHMLGFSPGFLYLGGLLPSLACPRKVTPSSQVPAGSVGIGGNQTGLYPQASPGGWHIIGRTPLKLFTPCNQYPCIAQPLDKVVFEPIDCLEFQQLAARLA